MPQEELNKNLMQACINLNNTAIQNYLILGANPNYQDEDLNTPLHKAIEASAKNIFILKPILMLLLYGADLNIPNNKGLSSLMITIQNNDLNIAQLLFEFGTINSQTVSTILKYCQQNTDSDTTQILQKFVDEYILKTELESTTLMELELSDSRPYYKLQAILIIILVCIFIAISNETSDSQIYY